MSLNNLELNSNKEDESYKEEKIVNSKQEDESNKQEDELNKQEDELNKQEDENNNKQEEQLTIKEETIKEETSKEETSKEETSKEETSKETIKINTLCFSGGGIKGFSFLGALERLIEKKIINLSEIKCFVGTSIGAMLSFLLILGWEIEEMKDFIFNFNFSKLKGEINSIAFFQNLGIQDGERFKLLLINFLEIKLNVKDITFEELYKLTNKKLIIIGTNLSKAEEVVFNYKTTPHFSVILALRISTAVPIIFSPVVHENEKYVDGGIVNNFPINHCSKKSTIGFYIKNAKEDLNIDSLKKLINSVLSITADTISEKNIKKYFNNVIQINNPQYVPTDFDITLEDKKKIIDLGYESIDNFLLKFNT